MSRIFSTPSIYWLLSVFFFVLAIIMFFINRSESKREKKESLYDIEDKLVLLDSLKERGLISQEEYDKKRDKLLDKI